MIPSIVFQWPWQIVHGPGLERQHWQHHILEQTKRLSRIMGCCCSHVIWEGVVQERGIRRGFVWTWPWRLHHPLRPWKMTLERHTKAPENSSKRWPLERESLIPLKDVDCVHNIHNLTPFTTNKPPDKGPNQTVLWVEFEVHMFLISARWFLRCHL